MKAYQTSLRRILLLIPLVALYVLPAVWPSNAETRAPNPELVNKHFGIGGGAGGSQTPWTGPVDAAGNDLTGAGAIDGTSVTVTGVATASQFSATGADETEFGLDLDEVLTTPTAAAANHLKVINHNDVLKRQELSALGVIPSIPDITPAAGGLSARTVASVTVANPGVFTTTADHGYTTGDGPFAISSTGTVNLGVPGWSYGVRVWVNVVDADEFSLSLTQGGASLQVTNTGDGTHTITPLTQSTNLAVCLYEGTTGEFLGNPALPLTLAANGVATLPQSINATLFRANQTAPAPALGVNNRGFEAAEITGTASNTAAGGLRLANVDMYPTLIGSIGSNTSASGVNTRVLHSYTDTGQMTNEIVMIVASGQGTGTEICAFSKRTCVFVEESVPPVDGVAAAWTWQACGDTLTPNNWARAHCSTVIP